MDQLLAFGGKLIQFSVKESDKIKNILIEARVSSLAGNEGEWENESDVILELTEPRSSISVNILQTRICLEIKTGFLLPVIVLQISSLRDPGNNRLFLVGLNLSARSLIPLQSVEESCTDWSDSSVSLTSLDGPVISWIKDNIHVMCVPVKDNPCQQQPTALPLEFKPNSILGSCFSCGRYIFVASQKRKPARAYCVSVSPFVCENLPIALFYSEEFTNIKKIHFVSVEICSNSADDSDPRIQTTLYAVTDEGYVLHFKDGQLVFAIPIGDEIKISSDTELHVFRPYGLIKTLVVVRSQDNVFLVDTAERQVIKTWRGAHSCHCDDFVGLGCPQLLILKEKFKTNSGWLLTDTFSVLVDQLGGDGEDKPTVEKHKDSTSAAIHALQTRLTNDLVNLSEKRREVTCRESFISSTWQTLQGNLQGRPLCQASKDPSMVTILNKREGQPLAGRTTKVVNRCERATVTEIWQRVVEGHWVIGVDCMAKNIISFQVVLVPEKGEQSYIGCITCSSNHICDDTNIFRTKQRSTKISEDISSIQNSQKKRRLSVTCLEEEEGLYPLIKHFPTCVASLPKFGMAKKVCCRVLLQWTEDDGQPPSGSQDCGVVCLSVEDIIRDKYNLKRETTSETESSRDLLALSLIQLDVGLKLEGTCPITSGHLKAWLEERAGFTYRPVYKCYMSDLTSLYLVRIKVAEVAVGDERLASFTLSARDMEQIALTLHHLYSCFPDNVLILPDTQQAMSKLLKLTVGNLEKELMFLTSAMKDFNKGKHSSIQEVQAGHEKRADGRVDVEKVRANFAKRKRDLLLSSDTEMVCVEETELFRKQLETLQLNTDRSMIDLSNL